MAYRIEHLNNKQIVCVRYSSEVTLEERMAAVHEVSIQKEKFKNLHILIDVREVKQKMNNLEQEVFGKYLASVEEFKSASIAVLSSITKNPNVIINKVSINAGYNLREFEVEIDALDWLSL